MIRQPSGQAASKRPRPSGSPRADQQGSQLLTPLSELSLSPRALSPDAPESPSPLTINAEEQTDVLNVPQLDNVNAEKRRQAEWASDDAQSTSSDDSDSNSNSPRPRETRRRKVLDSVLLSAGAYPRSLFQNANDEHAGRERAVISELLPHARSRSLEAGETDFTYFNLTDFTIYRAPELSYHASEMVSLDRLNQRGCQDLRFDGVLTVGSHTRHVTGVMFAAHAVEGYGDHDAVELADLMCIQSPLAKHHNIWYKLDSPAPEYRRFYKPFLWLARFTKFVDYLLLRSEESMRVVLADFRQEFHRWLLSLYATATDQSFADWLADGPGTDFRTTIAANYGYLWRECYNIDSAAVCKQPIWREILPDYLRAIKQQPNRVHETIVTPFAYACFQHSYFSDQLHSQALGDEVVRIVSKRKRRLGLTPLHAIDHAAAGFVPPKPTIGKVTAGDVVCVQRDTDGPWKDVDHDWFALVQAVRLTDEGPRYDILWLYQAFDTTIHNSVYPFKNELFLSDNCTCGKNALWDNDILGVVPVVWRPTSPPHDQFFVRQRFRTVSDDDLYDFTSLDETESTKLSCSCGKMTSVYDDCKAQYNANQMVLVREHSRQYGGEDRLQPAQILSFIEDKQRVRNRRFYRRSEHLYNRPSAANELIMTDIVDEIAPSRIVRQCFVRYFSAQQIASNDIVTPYDREGTGDHFFLEELQDSESDPFPPFIQGWDPTHDHKPAQTKLKGLALFCGGGNFDRGLEEGGAVRFRHVVDWDTAALHSYRANVRRRPERTEFFLGSVNDYLHRAMKGGADASTLAKPGEIEVISAGSPCPGFSALQKIKTSPQSKRNASMVASVVSFVDFYVPSYFILENVVTMTHPTGPNKENVFAQIVAALVGLGYQVQQFMMDAWSYGSPQQRSRVFIIASAPGTDPFVPPPHSHSHPVGTSGRSLGKSRTGLAFGRRRDEYTAFTHNTPQSSCADLPFAGDAQVALVPRYPDHRTPSDETARVRGRMAAVPTWPRGMGIVDAWRAPGSLRGEPAEWVAASSGLRKLKRANCYSRVFADKLFPTVVTSMAVQDAIVGRTMHWDEHRLLTIMEVRRGQGFLDDEVLIGLPSQKMRIVGNSVDRRVALVLGLALRTSVVNTAQKRASVNR